MQPTNTSLVEHDHTRRFLLMRRQSIGNLEIVSPNRD
jgi:hypothetical protein